MSSSANQKKSTICPKALHTQEIAIGTSSPTRIVSLDVLRGLTVAFMILVNDPGDWGHVYWPLDHAEWNGFTPTDLVFPTFLFLVGCAIVFSVQSRLARGVPRAKIALSMLRRALLIFAIKMFLTGYPHFHMAHARLFGVLTRIALCYFIAGLLFLYVRSWKALAAVAAMLLVGYWALMRFVPIPGLGHPVTDFPINDPDRNLAAWIDRGFNSWTQAWLHTGKLYEKTRDPEGLLSTLPSIATTILGIFAGLWLRAKRSPEIIRNYLLVAGLTCVLLGELWNLSFPINKKLWTSSFVLYAGGWSILLLALAYWLFDAPELQKRSRLARGVLWPMLVFGSNAITAYFMSDLLVETLLWIKLPAANGHTQTAWRWIYANLFAFNGSTYNTSLAFAVFYVGLCFLPNFILWRRKIFLRV
jgi:predicted acyltransferase